MTSPFKDVEEIVLPFEEVWALLLGGGVLTHGLLNGKPLMLENTCWQVAHMIAWLEDAGDEPGRALYDCVAPKLDGIVPFEFIQENLRSDDELISGLVYVDDEKNEMAVLLAHLFYDMFKSMVGCYIENGDVTPDSLMNVVEDIAKLILAKACTAENGKLLPAVDKELFQYMVKKPAAENPKTPKRGHAQAKATPSPESREMAKGFLESFERIDIKQTDAHRGK